MCSILGFSYFIRSQRLLIAQPSVRLNNVNLVETDLLCKQLSFSTEVGCQLHKAVPLCQQELRDRTLQNRMFVDGRGAHLRSPLPTTCLLYIRPSVQHKYHSRSEPGRDRPGWFQGNSYIQPDWSAITNGMKGVHPGEIWSDSGTNH